MVEIRKVTDSFAVAPQITPDDVSKIAEAGYRTIVANRPDGEGGLDQPRMGSIRAAAEEHGLSFFAIPFSGAPQPADIERVSSVISEAPSPVLAYCRTGTRSIIAWALCHAGQGQKQEIVDAAASAGYDLSSVEQLL